MTEPGYGTLLAAVDEVSIGLFSVTIEDTLWPEERADDHPDEWDEYEAKFDNVEEPYEISAPFWEAIGWDITDGEGNELASALWFGRQIIAVESDAAGEPLVEGAKFTPDGSGMRRSAREEESPIEWGERLQIMAQEWLIGRRG